ncbi:hypothetical protein GGS21DRAFT_91151 [Xylaria nigripes]|nr:hypothetical protein GGS21DRAFT_91151 [Xylaria nigripes]
MKFSAIVPILALAGAPIVTAAPVASSTGCEITAEIIQQIAPTSTTCSETSECRTNVQVAPLFNEAVKGLSPGAAAAVLALTAFESDDYKFKRNKFPGRPGQGTSNMQMINFNVEFAESIPELLSAITQLGSIDSSDQMKNQLLDLVIDDKFNFRSGPWFLTSQCSKAVVDELASASDKAFADYMACVGTTLTPERTAYWTRAKTALNL